MVPPPPNLEVPTVRPLSDRVNSGDRFRDVRTSGVGRIASHHNHDAYED